MSNFLVKAGKRDVQDFFETHSLRRYDYANSNPAVKIWRKDIGDYMAPPVDPAEEAAKAAQEGLMLRFKNMGQGLRKALGAIFSK